MKATAQMGGLTRPEIESWRAIWRSTYRDFPEPYRQLNELCDLALQAISPARVAEDGPDRYELARKLLQEFGKLGHMEVASRIVDFILDRSTK